MKINNIKINGFGKIENKEINFNDSLNIIYGKNENGKTTLLKFINSMFYGISKNKNGKEISDYEKYKPWSAKEFSGKIEYKLDDGKKYEVFRDFTKKNPQIFNEFSEDISKEFEIDKSKGNQFFFEQTKVAEDLFVNTLLAEQKEVILSEQQQNNLIQKLTNLASVGDEKISYKKTVDKLNKKLLEEVGTTRTTERPINILEEKIKKLVNEKQNLEGNKSKINQTEKNKENLAYEIDKLEKEIEKIKEEKKIKEQEKIEAEKIKINEDIIREQQEKIKILKEKINKKEISKKHIAIEIFILAVLTIIINIFIKNIFVNAIIDICVLIYIILKNRKNAKLINQNNTIKKEIKIIENNIQAQEQTIEKIEKTINNKSISSYEEINIQLEAKQNELNNKKIELSIIDIERNNIIEKLEDLSKLEEELEYNINQKEELNKLSDSIILAKETLEEAYKKAKNTIAPKFTKKLSDIINEITEEQYSNVKLSDENGLIVELENGNYISCNRLSTGTIEQMYLALRISTAEEISQEKLPIILDEPFVYYDNERLKNIFKYIKENFKEHQIIIFTCSDREKRILEQENLDYNYIEL